MRISDWSSDVCSSDLDADAPKEMVIVDGKQRLTAILGFLNGNVAVFGGHHFRDFDDQSQRDILAPTGRLRVQMAVHARSEEHTPETPVNHAHLVCRLMLVKQNFRGVSPD